MENLPIILKQISESNRVAIAIPEQASLDALCAAAALSLSLPGSMIFSSGKVPSLPFLSQPPFVSSGLSTGNQLIIKVSNQTTQASELRYEKTADGLSIYITPSEGQFNPSDVSVMPSSGNFDLVIIIGAANFEQLGKIYIDNTKLFFSTPHINIDNNPANEFYGTTNLVNATASSLCEIVMEVVEGRGAINNEAVATSLLAGIISQTGSFRDPKTTPSALQKASRLVSAGARQQDIIQHLFKTKPLPLLQLWGRALARLIAQPEKRVLTAVVTASDLQKTQVPTQSLSEVLRDIVEMVTGYSLIVFLAELPDSQGVQVLVAGLPYENISQIMNQLTGMQAKPALLVGKFEYVSAMANMTLTDLQTKLNEIIESRSSVV